MSISPKSRTESKYPEKLRHVFLSHPESVGESYFEHLRAAMGFAVMLAWAALAAALHAIVPALCETTARKQICKLHERLQARAATSTN